MRHWGWAILMVILAAGFRYVDQASYEQVHSTWELSCTEYTDQEVCGISSEMTESRLLRGGVFSHSMGLICYKWPDDWGQVNLSIRLAGDIGLS